MAKLHFARGRGLASMAVIMLGATALSGSALAQTAVQNAAVNQAAGTFSGQHTLDPGPRPGAPGAGGPLFGLSTNELNFFNAAKNVFNEVDEVANGLGPRFNMDGCGGCHAFPAAGGSSPPTNP